MYDFNSGQQIAEDTTELPSPDDLLFGEGSAALVFDTSIMGATSPIRGSRYRLELGQSAGNITFTNLTADVRTYLMPVKPYTFAFRGLYYARYGNEAEDFRLPTLYLGYPGLVRGYAQGSFETGECGLQPDGSCPTFDRLLGSRVAIFNAELRFPLWGALTGGRGSFYGPLPVEMAVFADSGVAWGQSTSVLYGGNQKEPVSSVGLAWRVNLMGFAVAEIDWVRPLDRPGRGWLWQFNLIPGF
jgi:outer membrane protein assembly factor BamA